ncbi:hypothetical protein GIB67_036500 [Kingdonia uniflora]|uniref:Uncharacterized protein n=1 Tax=Kingdonia uniflora TaxID=39325 RepID=A0A7J7P7K3_9MAGN|nr:hypothetical protein GIB67_036500 [Kingdonia uniflora]
MDRRVENLEKSVEMQIMEMKQLADMFEKLSHRCKRLFSIQASLRDNEEVEEMEIDGGVNDQTSKVLLHAIAGTHALGIMRVTGSIGKSKPPYSLTLEVRTTSYLIAAAVVKEALEGHYINDGGYSLIAKKLFSVPTAPLLRRPMSIKESFSSCCLETLMNLENVTPSNWTPVVDDLLLTIGVFLTYMAGIIPSQKAYSSLRQNVSNYDAVTANLTFLGSDMSSEFNPVYVWDEVRRKLMIALNAVIQDDNLNSKVDQREKSSEKLPFSLYAIAEIPRLRQLQETLQQLEKEVINISESYETVNKDNQSGLVVEIIKKCGKPVCLAWLEEELYLESRKHDKALLSTTFRKLKDENTILELRALSGWRYYFSLFLEFSDITMPFVRSVVEKFSSAISFFLVDISINVARVANVAALATVECYSCRGGHSLQPSDINYILGIVNLLDLYLCMYPVPVPVHVPSPPEHLQWFSTFRGGADQFIEEAERSLHNAIMIIIRGLKNSTVVVGGGDIDMEISWYLRQHARIIAGKSQLFINALAKALEITMKFTLVGENRMSAYARSQTPNQQILSRLSFQDEFDDSEFSCPFVVDDDDLTDPGFRYDGDSTIGHRLYKEITKFEFVKMKGKGRLTQPANSYQCIIVIEMESFKQIVEKLAPIKRKLTAIQATQPLKGGNKARNDVEDCKSKELRGQQRQDQRPDKGKAVQTQYNSLGSKRQRFEGTTARGMGRQYFERAQLASRQC